MARTEEERFMEKIEISPKTGCWLWAAQTVDGYGQFKLASGRIVPAHRFSYEFFIGPIPPKKLLIHSCDVRHCVKPRHLVIGDHSDKCRNAIRHHRFQMGTRHYNARLTPDAVRLIRGSNAPHAELARLFGVTPGAISAVRRGETWQSVSDETAEATKTIVATSGQTVRPNVR